MSNNNPPLLKFEDIPLNHTHELGSHKFTADDIIAFGKQFDPQPFHIDPVAAAKSHFGGLIASGWHTTAVCMRLIVDHRNKEVSTGRALDMGLSPGFRDLRWQKPVRPGDVLRYQSTTAEKVELKSRPQWGLLHNRVEARNQHDELVLTFTGQVFVRRRSSPDA